MGEHVPVVVVEATKTTSICDALPCFEHLLMTYEPFKSLYVRKYTVGCVGLMDFGVIECFLIESKE